MWLKVVGGTPTTAHRRRWCPHQRLTVICNFIFRQFLRTSFRPEGEISLYSNSMSELRFLILQLFLHI